jgi:hypothetical protein
MELGINGTYKGKNVGRTILGLSARKMLSRRVERIERVNSVFCFNGQRHDDEGLVIEQDLQIKGDSQGELAYNIASDWV